MTESAPPDRPPKRAKNATLRLVGVTPHRRRERKIPSAFGVVIRSVARNWDVAVVQF